MADSEAKDKTQAEPENPSGCTSLVRNVDGTMREQPRNEKGQLMKKPKPLIPTIEFTRAERKALNKLSAEGDKTEYMKAFMNIVRIAQYDGDDAKAMMAAVKAFEAIRLSALGKPAPSEQELDKLQTQPVKVIIVQAPQLMHPDLQEEKRETKTKPAFADAVVIEQN